MVTNRTLQALNAIWHELPRLVGPAWVDVFPKLKIGEVLTCRDTIEREWLICGLLDTLSEIPEAARVVERLEEVRVALGIEPGTRNSDWLRLSPVPSWPELLDKMSDNLNPPKQVWFTDITTPKPLFLGERDVITLRLSVEPEHHSRRVERVESRNPVFEAHLLAVGQEVTVSCDTKRFIARDGVGSEPIAFYVVGQTCGKAVLQLSLRQRGQTLATIPLSLHVTEKPRPAEVARSSCRVTFSRGGRYVPPQDIELTVYHRPTNEGFSLTYGVHTDTGAVDAYYATFESKIIPRRIEAYREDLLGLLGGAFSISRLKGFGERLFRDLIPKDLAGLFRKLYLSEARSLLITSQESLIPWELMKPDFDRDDMSWSERFELTRWVTGNVRPSAETHIRKIAFLGKYRSGERPDSDQGESQDRNSMDFKDRACEADYFSQLASDLGIALTEPLSTFEALPLDELLSHGEDADLWHLAAPTSAAGNGPKLFRLGDIDYSPFDLDRHRMSRIAEARPLVVLNPTLGEMSAGTFFHLKEWISHWIHQGQCGQFLAPLWLMEHPVAQSFCIAFYEALRRGEPLARAVGSAKIERLKNSDSMALPLAYTVYGHPNARIDFGTTPTFEPSLSIREQSADDLPGSPTPQTGALRSSDTFRLKGGGLYEASAPDLELRVQLEPRNGQTLITYELHSPSSALPFNRQVVSGPILKGDPETLCGGLLKRLEGMSSGRDLGDDYLRSKDMNDRVEGIGRELWTELFEGEIRSVYPQLREAESLVLVTDDPWIPWELVKPFDLDLEIDDPFFAEMFEMTRALPNQPKPPPWISVSSIGCWVEARDLSLAEEERSRVLGHLLSRGPLEDKTLEARTRAELVQLLEEGDVGLWHFVGHGSFDRAAPNDAGFHLSDGSTLTPSDFHGPVLKKTTKNRPLIFLNACCAAQGSWSWTQLAGWAGSWVRQAGCGAFIGPMWNLKDSKALIFADVFYRELAAGETLGAASRLARSETKRLGKGNPGWAAFQVYGHPGARLRFPEGEISGS